MLADVSMNKNDLQVTIWTVHVEVRLNTKTTARFDTIRNLVHNYLTSSFDRICLPSTLQGWEDIPVLSTSIERIIVSESSSPSSSLPIDEISLQIHVYQPSDGGDDEEFSNGPRDGEGEEVMAASACELPCVGWDGLWDSLVYSDNIKLKLLDYIHATLVLSDANVDFNIVSWNRVVLLHGPPGTGKTSLCRALAQKLSIRLSHRYPHSKLLEINSHSLFSRWFSESGKLVQRLFSNIMELVEDDDTFVVVLIDEVESLTAARAGAMAGTEPSDGLRVVNALLTQLDKLKHKKNVLVMSTSNLAKAIDSAFVDRADIIQYVDLPPREAIYEILRTCLCEMIAKGMVEDIEVPTLAKAVFHEESFRSSIKVESSDHEVPQAPIDPRKKSEIIGQRLFELASQCKAQGMSGRALRRLPVLALARYIGIGTSTASIFLSAPATTKTTKIKINGALKSREVNGAGNPKGFGANVDLWLDAMVKVVEDQTREHGKLS
ncbi:hypothetical protein PILCRDRAFT_162053 [Piloderma croceum F 1598]|uniref:AAA+ ATPase domain-containing protein n=1 Tax=Piloderma croceum (strain F 1598) TaxID=765440 RepID=A0A0C3GKA7_PILCF|nr:hypothetical protein PILCRDRAFT_162053 [Piloderma croceum F 1598]